MKLSDFFETVGYGETIFAYNNRILALKCTSERITRLMIGPVAMPWLPWRKTDCNIVHHQILDRICFVPHNNSKRNQWVFDINVSQRYIRKDCTSLSGTDLTTGQWICERAFAAQWCMGFVLLLWANPKSPPKGLFYVHVFVAKHGNGNCERTVQQGEFFARSLIDTHRMLVICDELPPTHVLASDLM